MAEPETPRLQIDRACLLCPECLAERSAIIHFGGMNLTREQADALALEQAKRQAPGQRDLIRSTLNQKERT